MEQSPARSDARAAPSVSGPTDMVTETPPSPKRPRDPSSGNKVSERKKIFSRNARHASGGSMGHLCLLPTGHSREEVKREI
eukprot:scaffold14038_cov110-Isochrysis_galbana.AAC.4